MIISAEMLEWLEESPATTKPSYNPLNVYKVKLSKSQTDLVNSFLKRLDEEYSGKVDGYIKGSSELFVYGEFLYDLMFGNVYFDDDGGYYSDFFSLSGSLGNTKAIDNIIEHITNLPVKEDRILLSLDGSVYCFSDINLDKIEKKYTTDKFDLKSGDEVKEFKKILLNKFSVNNFSDIVLPRIIQSIPDSYDILDDSVLNLEYVNSQFSKLNQTGINVVGLFGNDTRDTYFKTPNPSSENYTHFYEFLGENLKNETIDDFFKKYNMGGSSLHTRTIYYSSLVKRKIVENRVFNDSYITKDWIEKEYVHYNRETVIVILEEISPKFQLLLG